MKKKHFTTFVFTLSVLISFSQGVLNDTKKGLNISLEQIDFGYYLFPNLTLDYKKHSIAVGPLIRLNPYTETLILSSGVYHPTKESYLGFQIFYQYNFRPDKVFDYFIQTNFSYENLEFSDYRKNDTPSPIIFETKSKNIYQTLGTGCKLNFTKNLYLAMSVDLGLVVYKKLSYEQTYVGNSGFIYYDLIGILRGGIGFKI